MARPNTYSLEIAERLCKDISEKVISTAKICESGNYPSISTIYKWLSEHKEFSDMYARAKDMQAHLMAEQILEISDDSSHDTISTKKGDIENKEWVNRSRLRVDARKWLAAKLLPVKYGDKIDHTTGGDKINNISPESILLIAEKINKNAAS